MTRAEHDEKARELARLVYFGNHMAFVNDIREDVSRDVTFEDALTARIAQALEQAEQRGYERGKSVRCADCRSRDESHRADQV